MLDRINTFLHSDRPFVIGAVFFLIINFFLIATTELTFDEAYYWIYSEYLSFGYFDHPPMVGLFIKIGTILFGQNEIGVRIVFLLVTALSLFLVWDLAGRKNALIFWVSVFIMPLLNFSGVAALPDTPMLFFAALFFYYLKKYIDEDNLKNVFILAVAIAGMFYSKYHGLLIVLLTVCGYPAFLKRKSFYLIAIITTLLFLPHVLWQYANDFVSFQFHLTGRKEKHFDIKNILDYVAGQIALMGLFNFFIFCFLFYKYKFKSAFERIMLANSFGFLGFIFFLSFRNQIEANWTVSCTICLIILFTKYLNPPYKKVFIALAVLPLLINLGFRIVLASPKSFVHYFDNPNDTDENRLNELIDWKEKKIPAVLAACAGKTIVADNYQVASKLAFYTQLTIPAIHLDSRESQYSILKLQRSIAPDERICFLTSEDYMSSVKIETYYKDPIFVVQDTSLQELGKYHGVSYEEIIRDKK